MPRKINIHVRGIKGKKTEGRHKIKEIAEKNFPEGNIYQDFESQVPINSLVGVLQGDTYIKHTKVKFLNFKDKEKSYHFMEIKVTPKGKQVRLAPGVFSAT